MGNQETPSKQVRLSTYSEIIKIKDCISLEFDKGFLVDVLESKKRNIIFIKEGGRVNGTKKRTVV
jgi:hypothetical protein